MGSALADFPRDPLELAPVVLPPRLVAWRDVVVAFLKPATRAVASAGVPPRRGGRGPRILPVSR